MSAGTRITEYVVEEKKIEVKNLAGLFRTEAVRYRIIFFNLKKCNKEGEKIWYLLLPVWKDFRFYQCWALECKI
jgi:hypothetical protein